MTLRDALLTLAGPAWEMHADDRARQICFQRPGDSMAADNAPTPPATETVQTGPLVPAASGSQP
jgi:type IV pili sensor histidine kinase/response regulator